MNALLRTVLLGLWLATLPILVVSSVAQQSAPAAQPQAQTPGTQPGAQTPAAPKSFLPPRPSGQGAATAVAPVAEPPAGMLGRFYFWVAQQQQRFLRTLADSLRNIKAGDTLTAGLVLMAFSFAYGVLHAAGPGHGKAIVSSYMLADGQTVRRGVQLAFLSGVVQAFSALALFGIVALVLKGARTQIVATEAWLERASWAIVALFGLWLLIRQVRQLFGGGHAHHGHDHGHAHHGHAHHGHAHHGHAHHGHAHHGHAHHGHDHHDHHAHSHHSHDHAHDKAHTHAAHAHHAHDHGHDHHKTHDHGHKHHEHKHQGHDHAHSHHGHDHHCHDHHGHVHLPGPEQVAGPWSWRRAATLAFAVGIRPCTGAIGVLFVANGLGLLWAGVISTFVMALGTAITVSALAALAATSRDVATKLAGTADNRWAARAQTAIGLVGALLVFVLGASFFYYALTTTAPV